MESQCRCDGEISIGPFGGPGGTAFSYRSNAIKQIIIRYNNNVVESIMFKGESDNGFTTEYSRKFGGGFNGGARTDKIDIDFPSDFLTGVTGTYGSERSFVVVKSLRFITKLIEYGPFGSETGTPFSFLQKGGGITGFHGRADGYVDSIGFYLKPLCSDCVPMVNKPRNVINKGATVQSPGPWGGDDGRDFDDGVYLDVKGVEVHLFNNAISRIQFNYVKRKCITIVNFAL